MIPGQHVFLDGRFGVWFMGNGSLTDRAPKLKAFAGGAITDIFLPEDADANDKSICRAANLFVNLWTTPHNRGPFRLAIESLAALDRIGAGALELNIEVPDERINSYVTECISEIRKTRKALRVRVNIAPFKAGFLPVALFRDDPNLFLIEQAYFGNMEGRASESEVLLNMLNAGIPLDKCSVMYAASSDDPMDKNSGIRIPALPAMTIRALRRGSIYQDDLMADAGMI